MGKERGVERKGKREEKVIEEFVSVSLHVRSQEKEEEQRDKGLVGGIPDERSEAICIEGDERSRRRRSGRR